MNSNRVAQCRIRMDVNKCGIYKGCVYISISNHDLDAFHSYTLNSATGSAG